MSDSTLTLQTLLARVAPDERPPTAEDAELARELDQRLRGLATHWPTLELPPALALDYLLAHLPPAGSTARAWRAWSMEELYLCCGCRHGVHAALALFEQRYMPGIEATFVRQRFSESMREELKQLLRELLFLGDGRRPAQLERYGGLGRLAGWLRVVASRTSRRQLDHEKRHMLVDDERIADQLLQENAPQPAAELGDQSAYREAFRACVHRALQELEPRDVNLLRLRYADGLQLSRIGAIYRVHHATVLRWIGAIQRRLHQRVQELMMNELELGEQSYASVIRMMQSRLDLTLNTLLGSPGLVDDAP